MNSKELNELRRRITPERSGISKIYGCYVNANKEIIAYVEESLGLMTDEEAGEYLALFKKLLSGRPGQNLIDIVFSTEQVLSGEEHKLLMTLRTSFLADAAARETFYNKVIENLDMQGENYLILLAFDRYDVPFRSQNDETADDASEHVFSYFLCAVCPVKAGRTDLGYFAEENEFHTVKAHHLVAPPALGFLFPAFDARATNLYGALFYSRDMSDLHQDFIDAVFRTDPPMPAPEQKDTFQTALAEALDKDLSFDVAAAVHGALCEKLALHKESKVPEPLEIMPADVGEVLRENGVAEERVTAFEDKCTALFGEDASLRPANVIDSKKFEVRTPTVKIAVDPSFGYTLETRVIDGRKYLLIPADNGVELNGVTVNIPLEKTE